MALHVAYKTTILIWKNCRYLTARQFSIEQKYNWVTFTVGSLKKTCSPLLASGDLSFLSVNLLYVHTVSRHDIVIFSNMTHSNWCLACYINHAVWSSRQHLQLGVSEWVECRAGDVAGTSPTAQSWLTGSGCCPSRSQTSRHDDRLLRSPRCFLTSGPTPGPGLAHRSGSATAHLGAWSWCVGLQAHHFSLPRLSCVYQNHRGRSGGKWGPPGISTGWTSLQAWQGKSSEVRPGKTPLHDYVDCQLSRQPCFYYSLVLHHTRHALGPHSAIFGGFRQSLNDDLFENAPLNHFIHGAIHFIVTI